jgi:thiamine kinase-like enzyme
MTPNSTDEEEIRKVIEAGLAERLGSQPRIVRFARRQYEYWSSCALEELNIELADGQTMSVLFKDFAPAMMLDLTRAARHDWLYDPAREICVYTRLLNHLELGTAACYASRLDLAGERYWLFLEKINGRELYKVEELAVWQHAARWLARFHRLATKFTDTKNLRLLVWDRQCYQKCLERASFFQARRAAEISLSTATRLGPERFQRIATMYSAVVENLLNCPTTIIHGEFYASNVLAVGDSEDASICPIDWETAGLGVPLMDVAALVAGRWSDTQRAAIVGAYWRALDELQRQAWGSKQRFLTSLLGCRLHLAIQMLGRPPDWEPPDEHRHDWAREADELVEQLRARIEND